MNVISKVSPVLPPLFSGGSSDDHVTCRMCLIRFSYPTKLPLSLQCLHTFCSQCVYSWTCNKTKQKLPCPICGKVTKIERGRKVQECLPINHAVLELSSMSESFQNSYTNGAMNQGFTDYHPAPVAPYTHAAAGSQCLPASLPCHQAPACATPGGQYGLPQDNSHEVKIYPDLLNTQCAGSAPPPCGDALRIPLQPAESNSGCSCTNKSNTCCKASRACEPSNSKPPPMLQINIGSGRFRKPELLVEENPIQSRYSPVMCENFKPGAVTELSVNSRSPKNSKRMPEVPRNTCIAKISSDKCVRCCVNAASVTVTNSADKSVQRLCSECHAAVKEKRQEERDRAVESRERREPSDAINQARTVIKVQSKLNEEIARCSPVLDSRCKQSCVDNDKRVDKISVLKLGENSVTHTVLQGGQVGVVCGPFKTEQQSSERETEEGSSSEARVIYQRSSETSERERNTEPLRERNGFAEPVAATRVDIGTVDSARLLRTSNARDEVTGRQAAEQCFRPAVESRMRQAEALRSATSRPGRHREYLVRADGVMSAEEASRPLAFNPQYNEASDFDTHSVSSLGLPTVEPVNLLQRATTKEQEAMSYNNNNTGNFPTLSAPPRYEEIMADVKSNGVVGHTVKFGRYGESSSQPGALRNPSSVSVSHDGKVGVVDAANRTVQVFDGQTGECLLLLQVEGVNGCCHARDGSIVTATNKGVDVFKANGAPSKKVDMGPVVAVAAYKNGFVAAQSRALVAFKDLKGGTSRTIDEIRMPNKYPQSKSFQDIIDVAVNSQQDFVVLDKDTFYILGDEGEMKGLLKGEQTLNRPSSLSVDDRHNVLVCEGGRVLLFSAKGQLIRDVVHNLTLRGRPVGVGVGRGDKAYVSVRGDRHAEVIGIKYQ